MRMHNTFLSGLLVDSEERVLRSSLHPLGLFLPLTSLLALSFYLLFCGFLPLSHWLRVGPSSMTDVSAETKASSLPDASPSEGNGDTKNQPPPPSTAPPAVET